ncbi:MAG TPA: MgtC/SapB family protein [Caulobacteraceae bacterium]|nr:MgtC/SapB family protein [Caulobacteraceae bacterium]
MSLYPTWGDYVLRLALSFLAGVLVGLNREATGHPAGLRTTILVCLAAAVAMIQVNILLPVAGKPYNGFAVMDLMRLPLGILTGMGFIGGGAILRRGNLVLGITTAATLWMVTVIGLCFGGGQIYLGAAATALTFVVLWAMKRLDEVLPRRRRATLTVVATAEPDEIERALRGLGAEAVVLVGRSWSGERSSVSSYEVCFASRASGRLRGLDALAATPGVSDIKWEAVPE